MIMGLDDIRVALSTTSHTLITEHGNNRFELDMVILDLPICVSEYYIKIDQITPGLTNEIAIALMSGIGKVFIDPDARYLFIGGNPNDETTGLVIYEEIQNDHRATQFFSRWKETGQMQLEYVVYGINATNEKIGVVACISGLWTGNNWMNLRNLSKPMFTVIENVNDVL